MRRSGGVSALRPLQRRVVVTGLGVVCPLGVEVPLVWPRLLNGECGIRAITQFDVSALPSKIAAFVPKGKSVGEFDVTRWVDERDVQNTPPFLQYILCAAEQALQDSGWKPSTEEQKERTGVAIGNGLGSLDELTNTAFTLHSQGYRRVSPHFIPKILLNMGAGRVSLKYGLRGPNHTCSTACATGAHSIGDASRLIQYGDADVMLAGGAEACISPLSMAGFCRMKALSSKFNDTPEKASRPFDKARDGFVMGEGAGVIVLEEYEHAKARGARIYAEVGGYGLSGDAHHITAPSPEGDGAYRAMMTALRHSGLSPEQVDYVNAHATSTPLGDEIEIKAVKRVIPENRIDKVAVSSCKGSIGHLLGGAGAVESIFTILAIHEDVVPPTLNLEEAVEEAKRINLVPNKAQQKRVDVAIKNSFGFGGTNASLVLHKPGFML